MTKVSPTSDLSAFLAALGRSGLLSEEELASLRDTLASAGDAKTAARELLKQNKITRWQAGQLLHGYHQLVYGKYKLLDQLGAGEMGRVYLAEHGQLGRRVALKALARKHTADPQILKLFLSDARRVGGLDHPNLCHMYDVNQEGDRYFLVMEYVEGQNLQQFVEKGGKPSLPKVIEIIRQTAQGLGHAHAQKVLHGDLKPTNIIIDKNGVVKILDIGLSRLTEATSNSTVEDTSEAPSLASGIYRPQEQIGGQAVEPASDWYSLGAVLCFLLTGKPFQSPEACRTVEQLKTLRPDAPAELLTLCANLLAENPADRLASQEAVIAALDAASKAAVPAAAPAGKPPVAAKPPLPRAKAEPSAAPAKTDSSPGKPRKPPVARPLNDAPATSTEATASETPTDAFAFNLNTSSAPAAKKPPVKKTPAPAAVADSSTLNLGSEKAADSSASASKSVAKQGKSKMPLIIGGAIGGGVLVLLLAVGLIYVLMSGGDETTVADASSKAAVAGEADGEAADTSGDGEANPEEANPVEANPVEANPAVANAENFAAMAARPTEPAPGEEIPAAPDAPAEEMPADAAPTSAEGSDSGAAADAPAPMPAESAPASEPAPAEATAAPAEPPPQEKPKPAPKPAPAGNPFAGFAKAVSLPKLPSGMSEPTTEALEPVTLGPCKVDDRALVIINLLGGESATKGGRQAFRLEAANGGTAERDWEVQYGTENESQVIALLSVKNQSIVFQWTPEGAKHAAAPYLANCALEMSAGSGTHQCALRETVTVEPLVIDLEKPTAGVRWVLDALPDDQHMEIEIAAVQSGAPKSRVESNVLTADKPITNVLLGPADDKLPFAIELRMAASAKQVEIKATPKIKLEGLPPGKDRYNKKMVQTLVAQGAASVQRAEQQHMMANTLKNADQKKKALEQADLFKAEMVKANDQIQALSATVQAAQSTTVHFRVWFLADNGKVLLLDTGGPPPGKK